MNKRNRTELAEWEIRLLAEAEEIENKVIALTKFLDEPEDNTKIDRVHWSMLETQLAAMETYSNVVKMRLISLNIRLDY